MTDDRDMNQGQTIPVVNPFEDVVKDNLKQAAIQYNSILIITKCQNLSNILHSSRRHKVNLNRV